MSHTETTSVTDRIAVAQERGEQVHLDRAETIAAIRTALKRRSGKTWSVAGGTGTGWGWITIDAPPKRRTAHWRETGEEDPSSGHPKLELCDTGQPGGCMTPEDRAELTELLGLASPVHHQGHSIAASNAHRLEHVQRAEGRAPSTHGRQYWD